MPIKVFAIHKKIVQTKNFFLFFPSKRGLIAVILFASFGKQKKYEKFLFFMSIFNRDNVNRLQSDYNRHLFRISSKYKGKIHGNLYSTKEIWIILTNVLFFYFKLSGRLKINSRGETMNDLLNKIETFQDRKLKIFWKEKAEMFVVYTDFSILFKIFLLFFILFLEAF